MFLLSIPVYAVVLGLINGITGAILNIFTQNAATAWPAFIAKHVKLVVFLLSFSLVNMLFDYAKIGIVVRKETGVLKEWWNSVTFVWSHFWRTWGLYLIVGVLFLIVSLFYLEIERLIPGQSLFLILLLFIWQQVYMAAKLWFKLNLFASQIEMYRHYVQ